MRYDIQSAIRREADIFFAAMNGLATAKAQRDQLEIWWALEDIAGFALGCESATVRNRAYREIERHREHYRTAGCTDRFCSLSAFWDLPPDPFPYIEPANANDAPWRTQGPPRLRMEAHDGTVFHSDDFGGDIDATMIAFLTHTGQIDLLDVRHH